MNARLPAELHWLFWDVVPGELELDAHEVTILARVLERGRLTDVQWALRAYGEERIHRFFRDVGHVELSAPTIAFWRAYFRAGDERWTSPPAWRTSSAAPWID